MIAFPDLGMNLVYVDDVAGGVLLALDKGQVGESYVLGGQITTMREIIETLASVSGKKAPKRAMPTPLLQSMTPGEPGSTSTSSTCQQPITRSRPRCRTSISRNGVPGLGGAGGQLALGGEGVAQALLETTWRVAELGHRLVVLGPEGDAVGRT